MTKIIKRLKLLFIIGIVVSVVLCGAAIFLLFVTDDGSTTIPAIVCFSIAGLFVAMAMFDFFRPYSDLVLYDPNKRYC